MPNIEGVIIKELVTHPDERGYFREIIRETDPFFEEGFAQLSHSLMHPGTAKAWHIHKTQVDWWYVPVGVLKVALYDMRPDSPTRGVLQELFMGEDHGYTRHLERLRHQRRRPHPPRRPGDRLRLGFGPIHKVK